MLGPVSRCRLIADMVIAYMHLVLEDVALWPLGPDDDAEMAEPVIVPLYKVGWRWRWPSTDTMPGAGRAACGFFCGVKHVRPSAARPPLGHALMTWLPAPQLRTRSPCGGA